MNESLWHSPITKLILIELGCDWLKFVVRFSVTRLSYHFAKARSYRLKFIRRPWLARLKTYLCKSQKVPNRPIEKHQCVCFRLIKAQSCQKHCTRSLTILLKGLLVPDRLILLCIQRILVSMRRRSMNPLLLRHILAKNWKEKSKIVLKFLKVS